MAWLLSCCVDTELIVFPNYTPETKTKTKNKENGATVFYQQDPMVGVHWAADCVMQ